MRQKNVSFQVTVTRDGLRVQFHNPGSESDISPWRAWLIERLCWLVTGLAVWQAVTTSKIVF